MPACPPAAPANLFGSDSGSGGGIHHGGSGDGASFVSKWYSVVIYFCAQLFYSSEKIFEEITFGRFTIDLYYMFFWTLVTQVTKLTFLSTKLTFLSSKLTFLSTKLTFLSSKLTFLSTKLTFLSTKLTFLSSRGHPFDTACSPLDLPWQPRGNPGVNCR
jgi:hypothetical protein